MTNLKSISLELAQHYKFSYQKSPKTMED